jgi:hypothetical protein
MACVQGCQYGGCGTDHTITNAAAFHPPKPKKKPSIFHRVVHVGIHALVPNAMPALKMLGTAAKFAWKYRDYAKMALGVAALFVCTICAIAAYAAVAISAADLVVDGVEGKGDAAVFDALDLVSFGYGAKLKMGVKAAERGEEAADTALKARKLSGTQKRGLPKRIKRARMATARAKGTEEFFKKVGERPVILLGIGVTGALLHDEHAEEQAGGGEE